MDFQAFPPDLQASHVDISENTSFDVREALLMSPLRNSQPKSIHWISNTKCIPKLTRQNTLAVEEGKRAEQRFEHLLKLNKYEIVPTSEGDDYFDRIDVAIKQNNDYILIDVKAARRISRSDSAVQQKYTWLELHKGGSLFSGKSTHFAFELIEGFVLVDKEAVRTFILNSFNSNQHRVEQSTQAFMKPYRRKGRFAEWITLVNIEDLIKVGGILLFES